MKDLWDAVSASEAAEPDLAASVGPFVERYVGLLADRRLRRAALVTEEFERFAASLLEKRQDELCRALPFTARLCPGLGGAYRRFLADHPAPHTDGLLPPGLSEAWRADEVLRAAISDEGPVYAVELFAFERARATSRRDGRVRRLRARFALHRLWDELERGQVPIEVEPSPTLYELGPRLRWRDAP